MKTIVLAVIGTGLLAFGQQQPEVIQTPTDITIRLSAPPGVAGVQTRAGAFYGITGVQTVGGAAVKGAPYSAEAVTDTTQTLADGNRISNHQSSMLYRDGLGRERREETFAVLEVGVQSAPSKNITITDPVANTSYILNPSTRTAVKMPATITVNAAVQRAAVGAVKAGGFSVSGRMIPGGPVSSDSVKSEDLGSQLIEGVQANGKRQTRTIPPGQIGNEQPIQIVDEIWYSPELHMTIMSRHSDPRAGETVYKLTNIVRAEPDPSLFQVPPDFTIEAPRVAERER